MSCTKYSLSPEQHKPLHAQVTSLRAQRIQLIEENRDLLEEKRALQLQLQQSADKCKRLEEQTAAANTRRSKAEEEAQQSKAMSTQLLTAAGAWQTKLVEAESDHSLTSIADATERSRTAAQNEQERLRLFNELRAAQEERRVAVRDSRVSASSFHFRVPPSASCPLPLRLPLTPKHSAHRNSPLNAGRSLPPSTC